MELISDIFITLTSWIPYGFGIILAGLALYLVIQGFYSFIHDICKGMFILWDIPMLLLKLAGAWLFITAAAVWTNLIT